MTKLFSHPNFKKFADRYEVSINESVNVLSVNHNRNLTIHKHKGSGMLFVRLASGEAGHGLSISIAKLLLLTFKPEKYKKGKIALLIDKEKGLTLDNLKWGTRKQQTKRDMKNPNHKKFVYNMAKNYHKTAETDKKVKELMDKHTTREISQILGLYVTTVRKKKRKLNTK